jgi:dTDP-4-dehydrorhamnose 3,5-epimerase-like enzyme
LQQVLVCVNGSCRVLLDDGFKRESINLAKASRGLLVDDMMWHEMSDFSPDCVLLVLASDYYDENDYIRDYSEFIDLINS